MTSQTTTTTGQAELDAARLLLARMGTFATRGIWGRMSAMATPPQSTKSSLQQRLTAHAARHWPQVRELHIRQRTGYAYVDAELADGTVEKLVRLRYTGSASICGFAIPRRRGHALGGGGLRAGPRWWRPGTPAKVPDRTCPGRRGRAWPPGSPVAGRGEGPGSPRPRSPR